MNINKSNPLADHIENIINIQADKNTQKLTESKSWDVDLKISAGWWIEAKCLLTSRAVQVLFFLASSFKKLQAYCVNGKKA